MGTDVPIAGPYRSFTCESDIATRTVPVVTPPLSSTVSGPIPGTLADAPDLASSHLPLVAHLVRELSGRLPSHVGRDDLTSAGMLALVQAAKSFDPARGASFASYATPRVRGALLDELRGIDWASRSVRRRARDLDQTRHHLASALGRAATEQEVADATGMTLDEVRRNAEDVARAKVTSIHASEDSDLEGLLPTAGPTPADVVEHREQLSYMTAAVAQLPERLRTVVEQYFLAERPMTEIAAELGVSESRVSQIRAEALVLMRGAMDRALGDVAAPAEAPAGCAARRREAYYASVATAATASASGARPLRAGLSA
jgi:RNA polymerase sigma factor for flagellar operon FliA